MLHLYYQAHNVIGNLGCGFLSKANWPCLLSIQICENNIGSEGVKLLAAACWTLLKFIVLSTIME